MEEKINIEEIVLMSQKEQSEEKKKELFKKIIKANYGLAVNISKEYISYATTNTLDDLIIASILGIIKATKRYKEGQGENGNAKFSTFASVYIRGEILNLLRDEDKIVHIPANIQTQIRKFKQEKYDTKITAEEFCEREKIKKACFYAGLNASKPIVYLGQPIIGGDEAEDYLELTIRDNDKISVEESAEKLVTNNSILELLAALSEHEKDIILKYYGFEGEPMTLREISQIYGKSHERIRQVIVKSLRKIRRRAHIMKFTFNDFINDNDKNCF